MVPGISVRNTKVLDQMQKLDPRLSLEHRTLFEQKPIEGDWTFEFVARPTRLYREGDLLFGFSGGGPGYGDPLERDPEAILDDVKNNIISDWTARNVYKMAYDSERGKIDAEETKRLRDAERKDRLSRGRPYDEFSKEWSQKRPPEEILQFYGSWPDAEPLAPVFRP